MTTAYEIGSRNDPRRAKWEHFKALRVSHFDAISPLIYERTRIRALYLSPAMITPSHVEYRWDNDVARDWDSLLGQMIDARTKDFIEKCERYFPEYAYRGHGIMISDICDPDKWPDCGVVPR